MRQMREVGVQRMPAPVAVLLQSAVELGMVLAQRSLFQ